MATARRIFKNKQEILVPLLAQIHASIYSTRNDLTKETITNYISKGQRIPVLVFFNGDADKTIINRLGITQCKLLNIIGYDTNNDHMFDLQLFDFHNKKLIFSMSTKYFKKKGRLTNLTETHDLICSTKHDDVTYAHDPMTDVIYTKCIFDKLVKKFGIENIIKYLDSKN